MSLLDLLSWVLLLAGSLLCVVGAIGMLRFPDVYTRAHAAGINDTLGAGCILLGLMLQAGVTLVGVKLFMIALFMFIVGPVTGHALLKAAYAHGVAVRTDGDSDPGSIRLTSDQEATRP